MAKKGPTPMPDKYQPKPNARIRVKAQDGLTFKTGQTLTITVKGTLKSVNMDDYDGMMSIELEPATVQSVGGGKSSGPGSLSEDLAELAKGRKHG